MQAHNKKILFLIGSLNSGGAENVLVNLCNEIVRFGYEVTVQPLHRGGILEKKLDKRIRIIYTNNWLLHNYTSSTVIRLLNLIIRLIPASILYRIIVKERYDVEIAFVEGLSTKIVSGSSSKARKYAWYHTNPFTLTYSTNSYMNLMQEEKAYKRFNSVICVSNDIKENFEKKYHVIAKVIHNPIDRIKILNKSTEGVETCYQEAEENYLRLISVGRLVPEKGFDRLINISKRLKDEGVSFRLHILGTGRMFEELEEKIINNGLENIVYLDGYNDNPYPSMKYADLFVCSSLTEGLSSAVIESIILGVPVITTDCSGMKEIFEDYNCGVIVGNDEDSLFDGIFALTQNRKRISEMTMQAKKRSACFDMDIQLKRIMELFD